MSDLPQLLEGNHRFTAHFADGELPIRPRLSTVVLTCLDARVDPAHLFDLQLGDALVIRNGGGRINPVCSVTSPCWVSSVRHFPVTRR